MQLFLDLINNLILLKLNNYAPNRVILSVRACTCVHTSTNHTATAITVVQRY